VTPSNKQLVGGFLSEFTSIKDLQAFWKKDYPKATGRKLYIVGPNDETKPGVEAMLDVEYITAIGGAVNTTFLYVDGCYDNCNNEPYTSFVKELLALADGQLPHVVSMSYSDNENTVPTDFAAQADAGFMALGARGVSVLGSSGDGGVSGSQSGPCPGGAFIPTYPASSLYVLSVGATQGSPETAAGFSSGSFSNYFKAPAYQLAPIATYLKTAKGLPPAGVYNHTGRGVPDVSALGVNFEIVSGGQTFDVDGTSCSCPTFAGLVSLLNDVRLAAGKPSLGPLAQLFYKNSAAFTDVTSGNNPGCGTQGFQAAVGWDPITGIGSPQFAALVAVVKGLP
jgi:tripeptidyl-peptidase-1